MVRFKGILTPTPRGGGGCLVPVPRELELDTTPRVVEAPADLAQAIAGTKTMAANWEKLSFTNKKEMARILEEAKKPETREGRLAAAIAKLRA